MLASILLAAGLGFVAEKIDRGVVMRPVRGFVKKFGINLSPPTLTPQEMEQARKLGKVWKQECLEKFPILQITPNPQTKGQNGYLMLTRLEHRELLSNEFNSVLANLYAYDPAVARRCLKEHQDYIAHLEMIADAPARTSLDLPEDYKGFIPGRPVISAVDTLLLRASLAASEKKEPEALRCIRQVGNLIDHLRGIETPFLLSETVATLCDMRRMRMIVSGILPALGPSADLAAWRQEMNRSADYTPQRFADILRGEWQTCTDYLAFPLITQATISGELADGKGCLMVYAEWVAGKFAVLQAATSWQEVHLEVNEETFAHLPTEQEEMMDAMSFGIEKWRIGMARSSVVTAQYQAALELMMLEKSQGSLTAADAAKVTVNPITGEPFLFDPQARTLGGPQTSPDYKIIPITLPW